MRCRDLMKSWQDINNLLDNKLKSLEMLNQERDDIAGRLDSIDDKSLNIFIATSLAKYNKLLAEIEGIKNKAKEIKAMSKLVGRD